MSRQTLHFAWLGGRVKYELRQPCWRNNNNGACFTPRLRDEIRWRPHLYNSNWKECRQLHSKTPEVNYPKHKSFLVLLSLDSIQILHAAGMHGPLQMCAPVHMCRACTVLTWSPKCGMNGPCANCGHAMWRVWIWFIHILVLLDINWKLGAEKIMQIWNVI